MLFKKIIFTVLIVLIIIKTAAAQDYKTGIGIRGGYFSGLTVKHFINDNRALEGIIHFRYHGFGIAGLYEVHVVAFKVPALKFYYGGGVHIGFYDGYYYYKVKRGIREYYGERTTSIGIDGILGLEYKIEGIPFVVGVDLKPFFDIVEPGPGYWDGALNLRYVF